MRIALAQNSLFRPACLSRRGFACGCLALAVSARASGAHAALTDSSFDDALARIVGSARPAEGDMTFDIPEFAENGMMVSYSIFAPSPMTDADHVRAIHLLAPANLKPVLSAFRFTPASGKAAVAGRVRLAKTQTVVAVAELTGGRFLIARKTVNVTVGSCG